MPGAMTATDPRRELHKVQEARRQLGLRVSGFDVPRPVNTFEQCHFDGTLTAAIKRAGFNKPTAIQAQALPAALSGRDVLVRWHGPSPKQQRDLSDGMLLSPTGAGSVYPSPAGCGGDRVREDRGFPAANARAHHGAARATGG